MFRIISIIGFAAVFAGIILHYICIRTKRDELSSKELKPDFFGILRKIVYLFALLCFVVLFVTGFYQPLVGGRAISGFLVMIHATFAPVFAVFIAILAVMWAGNCVFDKNYWPWLTKLLQRQPKSDSKPQRYEFLLKLCFWVILVLALPLILSIVLSMFKIFGTSMQELFLNVHRYTSLVIAIVIILHTYLMIRYNIKFS